MTTMTTDAGQPKIAIFVADFSPTGVVVNALAVAGELRRRGVTVQFVAAQAEGTLRSAVPEGVTVTELLPATAVLRRRQRLRKAVVPYRRFLAAFAPAVVFSAGNQGHLTTVTAAAGVSGLRIVVRISNDPDHESGEGRRSLVRGLLRRLRIRRIAAAADRLIFVSHRLLDGWASARGAPASKAVVVPNGVDVDAVRLKGAEPCTHPWFGDAEAPVVLAVGRLVEQKNFGTLIQAVEIARRSRPLRLMLIGDGPLSEWLSRQAEASGLHDDFEIMGPVANPMPYMARAKVVALPSWWEGASNVLLEAIACGTAVVASLTAGSAEEVLGGGTYGVLVDPADPDAIAAALLKQLGPSRILPGQRALDFTRQSAMDAYADLLIEEARLAPSAAIRP